MRKTTLEAPDRDDAVDQSSREHARTLAREMREEREEDATKARASEERIAQARELRRAIAKLGVCVVCGRDTYGYVNGYCGPCWNRNGDVATKFDLGSR